MSICQDVGCPVSEEKTEWAEPLVTFLGMLLNGNSLVIAAPTGKVTKATNLLLYAISKKKLRVKFIQQLTGLLNFLNRAIIPSRAFTRRMYDKLKLKNSNGKALKGHHHIAIGNDFKEDCATWLKFLQWSMTDKQGICRPFIDIDAFKYAETLSFFTDALRNPELGMGDVFKH